MNAICGKTAKAAGKDRGETTELRTKASFRERALLGWVLCSLLATSASVNSSDLSVRPARGSASKFTHDMLMAHNTVRARVNLPPLAWSEQLAAHSQQWANALAARNRTSHNPNSPYGENIFVAGYSATPSLVVEEWASEARDYTYSSNSCRSDCGHYTQIVWRNTRRVGCAVARGAQREIWVCSYDPPGNYRGEWPY